jgi:phospholipid:diacylglycerol acyltransferase
VLERFFSRKERQKLFRSWAGSASMWLKGGDAVWGNGMQAPDDDHSATHSHGELIAFRQNSIENFDESPCKNMTADETSDWILKHMPSTFQVRCYMLSEAGQLTGSHLTKKMIATNYSFGIERDERELEKNNHDHRKWSNPLEVQ